MSNNQLLSKELKVFQKVNSQTPPQYINYSAFSASKRQSHSYATTSEQIKLEPVNDEFFWNRIWFFKKLKLCINIIQSFKKYLKFFYINYLSLSNIRSRPHRIWWLLKMVMKGPRMPWSKYHLFLISNCLHCF